MQMTTRQKLYSVCAAAAVVAMVVGLAVLTRRNSRAGGIMPPAGTLRAFSITNAPAAPATSGWSTNLSGDPAKVRIMQHVAAQVRANQSANATAKPATSSGGFRDPKQAEAMRQLQQRVGGSLQVYLRPENSTPIQLKGSPLAKAVATSGGSQEQNEATARSFLRDNAGLLLINDPDRELQLAHRQTDNPGGEVLRFTQHYQGLPVWPAEIAAHFDATGNLTMVDGAYIATPSSIATQPALTKADAISRAQAAVEGGTGGRVGTPELVVYAAMDQPAKLAWKVDISVALDKAWWVVVDAQTGAALTTISRVMTGNVGGSGTDLFGVTRPLNVWQSGSTYYMLDGSKPMFNATTGQGIILVADAHGTNKEAALQNNTFVTSASPNSWSVPDAVSASFNLAQTYDYYQSRFGRSSYNGSGSNLNAIIRIGAYQNASWNGELKMMLFGNVDRYAGSLDVIGHEVTHGVASSQGVLFYTGQSGALNEAFADVFGEMIEARTRGTNDWWIGSDLTAALRYMANPSSLMIGGTARPYPATMSSFIQPDDPFLNFFDGRDSGGVHLNSSIIGHAYYLLAAGLKNPIGNQDAERIFYRCLTVSMKPYSQFIDARLGCIAAAENIFGVGSQQALKTAEAFDVIELYSSPASVPQSANVNAIVSAPDSAMFVREHWFYTRDDLFRLESAKADPSGGTSLVTGVKLGRPSVSGNGTNMFFVGSDENLYFIQTSGSGFTNFNWAGLIHSVALSPQGRYLAMVLNDPPGTPTNQIFLFDLVSNVTSTVNLVTPVSDGPSLTNIVYADALSFSPDGKVLIYDALSRLRNADGVLRQAWSIFGLDLTTLQQQVVIPTVDNFDIGNPSFSKTSSRYVTCDAQYTNGNSAIITLDRYEGTLGIVGTSQNGLGYPVFNGDDSKVFYAEEDLATSSGRSVYVQPIAADKLTTNGSRALAISDAKLAVIYRRGAYPNINTAPSVTITNPAPNATFTAPASVLLAATASDLDGSISKVEFYNGDKLLFTDTAAPYGVNWINLSAGVYTVYARATDNQGATTTTAPVRFTVNPPAQVPVMNLPGAAAGFQFSLKLPQPGLYRLEASTNLTSWTSLGSFYCNTNLSYLDSSVTNFPRRFYRAVSTP